MNEPKRWSVERSFLWMSNYRRLNNEYEDYYYSMS
jgi:hypothetical protein